MEARQGRDAAGGSMRNAHDSATGHVFLAGDALTSMLDEHHAQDSPHAQGIEKLLLLLGLRLVRIPLMADSDSIPIADSVPGDGGHVARVS